MASFVKRLLQIICIVSFILMFCICDCKSTCPPRNLTAARAVRRPCRKTCWIGSGRCTNGKVCKCDHECGYSCINPKNTCGRPPFVAHMQSVVVKRNTSETTSVVLRPPHQHDDFVEYKCQPGYDLSQFKPIMCHGRKYWTSGNATCNLVCEPKNFRDVARFNLTCGKSCLADRDCHPDQRCLCDGSCGRSCVNKGTGCGEAPASSNATVNYTGQGFHRVAHYSCDEGFYLASGSPSRKCTGGGSYDGSLPQCARIECSDPYATFEATGGEVETQRPSTYSIGSIVSFHCPSSHRLLGPTSRTCLTDGRWSGLDSACDLIACIANQTLVEPGRRCRKSCQTDTDCRGKLKLCVCDNVCGMSCFNPNATCETLPPFANGVMSGNNLYGETVNYVCNDGFELEGSSLRICRSDKRWNGSQPVCKPTGNIPAFMCDRRAVVVPANGRKLIDTISGEYYVANDIIIFECNVGYHLTGSNLMQCLDEGQWNAAPPMCEAFNCDKVAAVAPSNARIVNDTRSGDSYVFNDIVTFKCNVGYRLIGSHQMKCFDNGRWNVAPPTCEVVVCDQLAVLVPSRGRITNSTNDDESYVFNDIVTFECNVGYRLIGSRQMRCLAEGRWSAAAPSCQVFECDPIAIVAPANGRKTSDTSSGQSYVFNDVVTFKCSIGYRLIGSHHMRCLDKGRWSVAVPTCKAFTCDQRAVAAPVNGRKTSDTSSGQSYVFNDVVTFECNIGYRLIGSHQMRCLVTGRWNVAPTTCEAFVCDPLAVVIPVNGIKTSDTSNGEFYVFNDTVTFECNVGYRLIGSRQMRCLDKGRWNVAPPTCEAFVCDQHAVVVPVNGRKTNDTSNGQSYAFNDIVTFECNIGYRLVGSHQMRCLVKGKWSVGPPACEAFECDPIEIVVPVNGRITTDTSSGQFYIFNDIVTFKCDVGYRLIGSHQMQCLDKGIWNAAPPACEVFTCDQRPVVAPTNGRITSDTSIGESYVFNDVVTFACNVGYHLAGRHQMRCWENGKWNATAPRCEEFVCDSLAAVVPANGRIANGSSSGETYAVNDIVTFKCNVGYRLVGSRQMRCLDKGRWNVAPPTCEVKLCNRPQRLLYISNARVIGDVLSRSEYGTTLTIKCSRRYKMTSGSSEWICSDDEKWHARGTKTSTNSEDNIPVCRPICGVKNKGQVSLLTPYISRGTKAQRNEYPWMVLLQIGSRANVASSFGICSGTLISQEYVLTAAHCVTDLNTMQVRSAKHIFVWLGVHDRLEDRSGRTAARSVGVSQIIRHPDYNRRLWDSDFALLRLANRVRLSNVTQPICLPEPNSTTLKVGRIAGEVAGWGFLDSYVGFSSVLRKTTMPTVTKEECWRTFLRVAQNTPGFVLPQNISLTEHICAGSLTGNSGNTCQGDSGGPFMLRNSNNEYTAFGVVSFGLSPGRCGQSLSYSVFAKLDDGMVTWVKTQAGLN